MSSRTRQSWLALGLVTLGLPAACGGDEGVSVRATAAGTGGVRPDAGPGSGTGGGGGGSAGLEPGGAAGSGHAGRGGGGSGTTSGGRAGTGGLPPTGGTAGGGRGGASSSAGTSGQSASGGAAGAALGGTAGVVASGGAATAGTAGTAGSPSDLPCARNGDCSGGQVCGERRTDGRFYCTAPATGGGTLGAPCTTGPTTTECHDRVCLVGVSPQCSRPCVDDADCADVTGFVCNNVGAALRFCMQACQAPADCQTGLDCALSPNVAADRWDFVCQLPYGPVASGGDCTLANNCSSGLCLYGPTGLN
jgi:hypothetical protein